MKLRGFRFRNGFEFAFPLLPLHFLCLTRPRPSGQRLTITKSETIPRELNRTSEFHMQSGDVEVVVSGVLNFFRFSFMQLEDDDKGPQYLGLSRCGDLLNFLLRGMNTD